MYKSSAPGTIKLLGEYAVLHGYPAIACALDRRIHVQLVERLDDTITIHGSLGDYEGNLKDLPLLKPPYQFVLAAISQFKEEIATGFGLTIESDFSSTVGLGSSSAVSVATVSVLAKWLKKEYSLMELYQKAYDVVLAVQGKGSGIDVAASVFGGVIYYQLEPFTIINLTHFPQIELVYSGSKVQTVEMINHVDELNKHVPDLVNHLYQLIGHCSEEGKKAIESKDWDTLGTIFNVHQGLHDALGTSSPHIATIIDFLRKSKTIQGAKISGAGLGDCVVAIGKLPSDTFPQNDKGIFQMKVEITSEGVGSA
ncbi:mevalonate kinase [Chlamydiales bacterium]|nr:mevalonate kinase [Chlamydiales bacterium]